MKTDYAEMLISRSAPAPGGCWIWLGYRRPNGYGRMTVRQKQVYAHRFAFEVFTGKKVGGGMDVCHKCDDRLCINPQHLFEGTRTDNMRDAKAKGRLSVGAEHGAAVRRGIFQRRGYGLG